MGVVRRRVDRGPSDPKKRDKIRRTPAPVSERERATGGRLDTPSHTEVTRSAGRGVGTHGGSGILYPNPTLPGPATTREQGVVRPARRNRGSGKGLQSDRVLASLRRLRLPGPKVSELGTRVDLRRL